MKVSTYNMRITKLQSVRRESRDVRSERYLLCGLLRKLYFCATCMCVSIEDVPAACPSCQPGYKCNPASLTCEGNIKSCSHVVVELPFINVLCLSVFIIRLYQNFSLILLYSYPVQCFK